MTITVVCDVLGEETNGTIVVTMNLIRHLKAEGHTVRVLCADQSKKEQENYYVAPIKNFGPFNGIVRKVGVTLAKADKSVVAVALEGTDHVHVMLPFGLGLAAAKLAHTKELPLTAGFHMQAENLTGHLGLKRFRTLNKFIYHYIYKHLYRYCDAIHYPTQFIRDVFEKSIGKRTPGYVISNGVHSYIGRREVEKPQDFRDKIVILSTGRYSSEKSQDTLIKAIARSEYKDKIQLILAGQGLKEKKYKRLAKRLPVAPIFRLYGRNELCDALNYCDLYIHPAVDELEGIACLESIACGKMTIVSDSKNSATKEFAIDEKCIFKHRDAKDLARVIDFWIEHPEERKEYEAKYLASSAAVQEKECMRQMDKMIAEVGAKKRSALQNFTQA